MPHDCRVPIQDVVHLFTFDVDLSAAYAKADKWLLLEFIVNIVMNAVKYSDSKTQICIRSYKDDDRTIAIEVEDLVWGISEEDLKPVEQPFYQATSERSELGGIGLSSSLIARSSILEARRILFHTQSIGTGHHGENYSSVDGHGRWNVWVLEWGLTISAGAPDPWHLLRRTPWREEGMSRRCRMGHPGCRSNSTSPQGGHSIQEPTLRCLLC